MNGYTIGLGLLTIAASAASGAEYFGLQHTAIGDATFSGAADGPLIINGLGSTGKDGVEVELFASPPGSPTTQTVWEAQFDASSLAGAVLVIQGVGDNGGGFPAIACSTVIDFNPAGPTIHFDFSGAAPATLGARYFSGNTLVLEEHGVDPVFAPIGGFPPVLTDLCGSVHFDPTIQQWVLDGCLAMERTIGGEPMPGGVDYWQIFTEGTAVHYDAVTGVRMLVSGTSTITINDETLTHIPVPSGCPGDADGDSDVDFDDLNAVLSNWGGIGPQADVHPNGAPDGQVNFDDLNEVLGHWGDTCP